MPPSPALPPSPAIPTPVAADPGARGSADMRLRRGARPATTHPQPFAKPGHPHRIAVIGGGPGGLYAAVLLKRLDPTREITVWERNAPDDTFGFGVVLSDETLGGIEHADPLVYEALQAHFTRWDDIDIVHRNIRHTSGGHGFAALGRRRLLQILHDRCRALGVELRFGTEAPYPAWLCETYDLVIAADGVHSATREAYAEVFRLPSRRTAAATSGSPPTSPSSRSASRSPRPSTA